MTGRGYSLKWLIPAYYQLGMWRVYLQRHCCVCHTYPAILTAPAHTHQTTSKNNNHKSWQTLLCQECHEDIKWLPEQMTLDLYPHNSQPQGSQPQDSRRAFTYRAAVQPAAAYLGVIRAAIIAFKYKEDMSALPLLVHALRQLPRPVGCHKGNSVIVPMPTTDRRLRKRGFDPVTILSYYLSQHWGLPLWQGVIRSRDAHTQQGLTRIERLSNLKDAFTTLEPPPAKNLILFDDVATTGASLTSLAIALISTDDDLKLSACTIAHGN